MNNMENKIIIHALICILKGISLNNIILSNPDRKLTRYLIENTSDSYIKYNDKCINLLEQYLINGDDYVSEIKKSK